MENNHISKRLLKAPLYQPLLVYEIKGETLVPAIMGDKAFDYVSLFHNSYQSEAWWFGYFSRNEKYKSLKDFKNRFLEDKYHELEKEVNKVMSEEYYLKTKPLVEVYLGLKKAYEEELKSNPNDLKISNKYMSYLRFVDYHPELSKIDIRFAHVIVCGRKINENCRTILNSTFYDPKPDASLEEVKDFSLKYYKLKKKEMKASFKNEGGLLAIKYETNYTKKEMLKLLKTQSRIGLVFINGSLLPDREEVEMGSIKKFDENLYTSLSWNTIYWFTK